MKNQFTKKSLAAMLALILAIPLQVSASTMSSRVFAAESGSEAQTVHVTNGNEFNETFDTIADANTLLNDSNKNDKLGYLPNIEIKTGIVSSGYKNRRGYIKFDLTSVTKAVKRAKLRISAKNITNSTLVSVEAYQIADDSWQESTITGANAPAMGSLINSVNVNASQKYYDIDVTSFVQDQMTSDKLISIGLMVSLLNKDIGVNINSKEGMASPPKLFIDYMSPSINSVITAPTADSYYLTGKDVQFTGSASDDSGKSITSVEIYANDTLISTQPGSSYTFKKANFAPGTYDIYAKAINEDGEAGYSEKISITVSGIMLTKIFSDNMLFQRNKPIVLKGTGLKNISVTAEINGISASTTVGSDGKWEIRIPSQPATKSTTLKFTTSEGVVKQFNNVAIGELILCTGQSNMETDINYYPTLNGEVDNDYEDIRLFKQASPSGVNGGRWTTAKASEAYSFSAIGYMTGKYYYLSENGNVPVGLIFAAVGGTTLNLWATRTSFDYDPDTILKKNGQHYSSMVSHWTNMTIGHVLWYQGESDTFTNVPYEKLLTEYIDGYREAWNDESINFTVIQLPSYDCERAGLTRLALGVKDAQFNVSQRLDNVATVVSIDTGEPLNVHPADKTPVAMRAALAIKHFANPSDTSLIWKSPSYSYYEQNDNNMIIHFKDIADGLKTTDGKTPRGFKVAGDDGKFVDANATLIGDTIVIDTSTVVGTPKVRYACEGAPTYAGAYTVVNVANSANLPLAPFRTDNDIIFCTTRNADGTLTNPLNFAPTIRKITASDISNGVSRITVNARDYDGYIQKLEVYADTKLLGTATLSDGEANYTFDWENPTLGSHTLYAIATDEKGTTSVKSDPSVGTTTVTPRNFIVNLINGPSYALLPFTDLLDKPINTFEGENGVSVQAVLGGTAKLIVAAYNNDKLVGLKIADGNTESFTADELKDATKVRAFIFSDMITLQPLAEANMINRIAK
ncbi:MAG: DNRLRE domain-containing protein [Eubacteriales bacterium]|nr:DNRLRE domain-containing protein [Eubacteriales bacterium]